jgi:hypothetical protein
MLAESRLRLDDRVRHKGCTPYFEAVVKKYASKHVKLPIRKLSDEAQLSRGIVWCQSPSFNLMAQVAAANGIETQSRCAIPFPSERTAEW